MKLTLLSKGGGYHFPPCYLLHLCGFRILLECPIDLSALLVFDPLFSFSYHTKHDDSSTTTTYSNPDSRQQKRQKLEKFLEAKDLISAQPWFKMVPNVNLWDLSFIDVVLISSPMGMLGLPFLTQHKNFSAKVYATEATKTIGKLMMEDLVSMNLEFKQFYGPNPEESEYPQWMKWADLELLPTKLKDIVMGDDGVKLGGWRPLYSDADVNNCMLKVQPLKYAEEACYNGTLVIKAFSSGLEIGASNWTIDGPSKSLTYLSSSIFESAHAMNFDFHSLQGKDTIMFTDCSILSGERGDNDDVNISQSSQPGHTTSSNNMTALRNQNVNEQVLMSSLVDSDKISEENDKLAFICTCAINSVTRGGSVLIPIGRLGVILQLLEQMSMSLESSNLEVPIFMISSVAEEMLAFTNAVPEWLCKQRQENLYSGEALFGHVELIKRKRLHVFPAVHSADLIGMWQEPCIVFAPHWSLRLGPVVHLLRRWCVDPNSLLILEQEVDADLALLPFKPIAMKVLQCSFLSGFNIHKIQPLLGMLHPKLVLFPRNSIIQLNTSNPNSFSVLHYSENEPVCIPSLANNLEAILATDLALQLQPKMMKGKNMAVARLKGKLILDHGRHMLVSSKEPVGSSSKLLWGSLDPDLLVVALHEKGIGGSFDQAGDIGENICVIHIHEPAEALVHIHAMKTIICATDGTLACLIFEVISSILNSI